MTTTNATGATHTRQLPIDDGGAEAQPDATDLSLTTPQATTHASAESIMHSLFALMEGLARDVRHAGETQDTIAEKHESAAEESSVSALREKASNALWGGVVGGLVDLGAAGAHMAGAEAATNRGRELAKAGGSLCDATGKMTSGAFKQGDVNDDLHHQQADANARHAQNLAKHAADMVSDGTDLSRAVLEQMKQYFDQATQVKMSIHYA